MIKKIIILVGIFFLFFGNINAKGEEQELKQAKKDYQLYQVQKKLEAAQNALNDSVGIEIVLDENYDIETEISKNLKIIADTEKQIKTLKDAGAKEGGSEEKLKQAKENYDNSPDAHDDLSSRGFEINTSKFTPVFKPNKKHTAEQNLQALLGTIIQKFMVALGVLSVLMMTIGGGYMILHHGEDSFLSKGKSIFLYGIGSMVVALSSYYIVAILRFILYN